MSDDNTLGKILGHILLAILSFVLGAFIGLIVAGWIIEIGRAIGWEWLTHRLVSVVCALGGGLLFVFCGESVSRAWEKYQWNRYWK